MSGGPVSVALPVARGGRPRPPRVESDARVGVRGERFALATAAVAVATLPSADRLQDHASATFGIDGR